MGGMYVQPYYPETPDELRHVVPGQRAVEQLVSADATPFRRLSMFDRARQFVARGVLVLLERLLQERVYVENRYREINALEPRSRALLTRLMREGIVVKWLRKPMVPGVLPLQMVLLDIAPTKLLDGRTMHMGGSTGNGTGRTLNEAIIPAFGELLERYSCTRWQERRLFRGSQRELMRRGAVDPAVFTFYSPAQLQRTEFARSHADENTHMQWIRARTREAKRVLIPAQLVYLLYQHAFPEEPIFMATTSNAAAAGSSYAHAAYGALCEAIERDGLMIFWLNKIAPARLDVEQSGCEELIAVKRECDRLGIVCEVLNCTTELGVPSFVSVIVDRRASAPIHMSAAADLSVSECLKKLARETHKALHTQWYIQQKEIVPTDIRNLTHRQQYWASQEGADAMEFFLSGRKCSISELTSCELPTYAARLKKLREIFRAHDMEWYLSDITAYAAYSAGLCVVRAVVPALVPIHFNEQRIHLGVKRLYCVPRLLGYRAKDSTEEEINALPHPFL